MPLPFQLLLHSRSFFCGRECRSWPSRMQQQHTWKHKKHKTPTHITSIQLCHHLLIIYICIHVQYIYICVHKVDIVRFRRHPVWLGKVVSLVSYARHSSFAPTQKYRLQLESVTLLLKFCGLRYKIGLDWPGTDPLDSWCRRFMSHVVHAETTSSRGPQGSLKIPYGCRSAWGGPECFRHFLKCHR